jgi:histidinol-phosphate aminotransferase
VGTKNEMAKFKSAFVKCMDKAPASANGASLRYHPALIPSELRRNVNCA